MKPTKIYRVNAQTLGNEVVEIHTTRPTAIMMLEHLYDVIESHGYTDYCLKGTITMMQAHNGVFEDVCVVYEREING